MDQESKSKKYHQWKRVGSISELAFMVILLCGFVWGGESLVLRETVETYSSNPWVSVGGYFSVFGLAWFFISLPFHYGLGHKLEHRFGLSNETLQQWLWEKVKALLVLLLLGGIIVEALYYLLRETGNHWWWIAAFFFVCFSVILTRLAPSILMPIFFRFQPLADGELKDRLVELSRKAKTGILGVFEMDLSRKTKAANAALAGMGKSRRIILSDTMTRQFSVDEVEVVMAHELGHHVFGHLWKMIGLQSLVTTLGFYLSHRLIGQLVYTLGYRDIADVAGFPVLILVLTGTGLALSPLTNWVSRSFERDCDRYAIQLTGNPQAFTTSMKKLSELNLAEEEPPRWIEVLFHGHPSIRKRIRFAEQMAEGMGRA